MWDISYLLIINFIQRSHNSLYTLDVVIKENRQILDWTKNKNYYKIISIKWRGCSVG